MLDIHEFYSELALLAVAGTAWFAYKERDFYLKIYLVVVYIFMFLAYYMVTEAKEAIIEAEGISSLIKQNLGNKNIDGETIKLLQNMNDSVKLSIYNSKYLTYLAELFLVLSIIAYVLGILASLLKIYHGKIKNT